VRHTPALYDWHAVIIARCHFADISADAAFTMPAAIAAPLLFAMLMLSLVSTAILRWHAGWLMMLPPFAFRH